MDTQNNNYRHGKTGSRVYNCWGNMLNRCGNPREKNYGAKGVKVCARWHKFENFLADMGEPPPKHSLDRINGKKGYSKSNCRWATRKTQNLNRCSVKKITFKGKTQHLREWADELGISYFALYQRIKVRGWSKVRALTSI